MSAFESALAFVFGAEGGVADRDRTADPGGLTNMGITTKTLVEYHSLYPDDDQVPDDVLHLSRSDCARIYRRMYWDPCRCDDLPAWLALLVFDASVHHGPARAVKWLQDALGLEQDGVVGRRTLAAAAAAHPHTTVETMAGERLWYLHKRPHADANRGWFKRRMPRLIIEATRLVTAKELV